MGMYDFVICEYPLPDSEVQDAKFQTKDFDCNLDEYVITKDGMLIHKVFTYEVVPEEERPYYGTPKWDDPLYQLFGMLRLKHVRDEVMSDFHGDVRFYTFKDDGFYEYVARFSYGKLDFIKRIEEVMRDG